MSKKKKRSDKSLQFDNSIYQFLTENITDVIWVMDVETRKFVYMSPSVEKFRGYTQEEVMAQDVFQALCPPYQKIIQEKIVERLLRYKKTGVLETFKDEVQQPCKDGSIIWSELATQLRINPANNRTEVIGTSRDISDRKKIEADVAYRETSIRKIIEQTAGKKGHDYFNAMVKVLEEVTKSTYSFIGEMIEGNNIKSLAASYKGKIQDKFIYNLKGTPCDTVIESDTCVYPSNVQEQFPEDQLLIKMGIEAYAGASILDHKGSKIGIIVSLYDKLIDDSSFTESIFGIFSIRIGSEMERLKVEEELEHSESRYRMLSDLSKEGIVIHQNGQILSMNKPFCEIFGYTEEELKAYKNPLPILLTPDSVKLAQKKIDTQFKGIYTLEGIKKDGSHIYLQADGNNIIYEGKKVRVATFRDITEKKKILDDLKVAKEKAEESDRLKSAFLASMSHEIRTPLNSIVGFSNIIAESSEDPELAKFSDLIVRQNDLLLQIIDDIIDFARFESGDLEFSYQSFCLGNLINEVFLKFRTQCPKDVDLIMDVAQDTLYVHSDEQRIKQIFINLISNAIKFTQSGAINFGFRFDKDDEIICYVSDTGVGIPKEQQTNIFNRFTKLDTFTQGTGLGLAIIHHIVKLMSGEIWLESEPDKGSSFYFKIPLKNKNKPKKSIRMDIKKEIKTSRKEQIVLIVEDDESNYLFLKELMNSLGLKSLHAISGNDAIDLCKNNKIDLVLMDLKLPELDGFQATIEIKKMQPNLPIIAQTAYALKGDEIKAKDVGCDEYITKPLKKEDLFILIEKYI